MRNLMLIIGNLFVIYNIIKADDIGTTTVLATYFILVGCTSFFDGSLSSFMLVVVVLIEFFIAAKKIIYK